MDRIKKNLRSSFFVSFFLNLLFLVVILLCFSVRYETNDDQLMSIYLYGLADGQTSPFLIYINIALGWLLKALADAAPGVPWYSLFAYAAAFFSFTAICGFFLRRDRRAGFVFSVLLLCSFGFDLYTRMQFTKLAGCGAVAGALLLLDALEDPRPRIPAVVCGTVLMLLGSCYRFRQFLLVLAAMGCRMLFLWLRRLRRREYRLLARQAGLLLAALALCFGLYAVNARAYASDPGWSSYLAFNNSRVQLVDRSFPDYDENRELYESLGLSEEDIELYKTWDFGDPELFNSDTVTALAAARQDPVIDGDFWSRFEKTFSTGYFSYFWLPAFLFAAAIAVYASRRNLLWLAYALAFIAALSAYLFYYERYLANRVDTGVFLALTVSLLAAAMDTQREPLFSARGKAVLAACLAALVFLPTFASRWRDDLDHTQTRADHSELFELVSADTEHVYVYSLRSGDALRDALGMWRVPAAGSMGNMCAIGGCSAYTPEWYRVNEALGIDNPFSWVVDNENALLLDSKHISAMVDYICRHYDADAYSLPAKNIGGNRFYRIVTAMPEPGVPVSDDVPAELRAGDFSYERKKGKLTAEGTMYLEGRSSFPGEAYLELVGEDGAVQYRPMTQFEAETPEHGEGKDDLHGRYGAYSVTMTLPGDGSWHVSVLYRYGQSCWRVYEFDV